MTRCRFFDSVGGGPFWTLRCRFGRPEVMRRALAARWTDLADLRVMRLGKPSWIVRLSSRGLLQPESSRLRN